MPIIEVDNLRKEFKVYQHRKGFWGAIRNLASSQYSLIKAVDGISFGVDEGQMIGYVGPNGAGKSTTIKMLTGILVPTSGKINVAGLTPHKNRKENARRIGVVFGQRTQLWWDLPVIESFQLLRRIYRVSGENYSRNLDMFHDLLNIGDFINTPVRKLSLGQRMRCDLAAALLHDPPILYLDEPTIGLDVVAKQRIRTFLNNINQERKITIVLTTHDLADVEKLCRRMMIIDHGKIIYDGTVDEIKRRYGKNRRLVVDFARNYKHIHIPGSEIIRRNGHRIWLQFNRDHYSASQLISQIAEKYDIIDLTLEEPEIETIVAGIYEGKMEE
ncbi:ATP-binding cassette domain-containing protein [Candidatus Poribacteria bacterium]|nr:ATP-binding cassette domain-containing protein [Candidatus Poribacteria bacterium]